MVSSNPNETAAHDFHAVIERWIRDSYESAQCETCGGSVYVPKKPGLVIVSVKCDRARGLTHTVTVTNAPASATCEILIGPPYVENESSPPVTP